MDGDSTMASPREVQVHLDLVGGLAGDMFAAALLDAFPEHEARVLAAVSGAFAGGESVTARLVSHGDGLFRGRRFLVASVSQGDASHSLAPRAARNGALAGTHTHAACPHATWREVREGIERAEALPTAVRGHAIGIFQRLADAEARVHGIPADAVSFHEVGAWDSRADIIAAATLIDAIGASRWTTSPAPLGAGRVPSDHGLLPLPAPATAVLLEGFATVDDGIPGERVTPTGAAILRYLCDSGIGQGSAAPVVRTLLASGVGFGGRRLPGISNHTRVLVFEAGAAASAGASAGACAEACAAAGAAASAGAAAEATGAEPREIHVIEFEVDDQSGEDLATGLERLRALPAVLDVTHAPAFGKKGRMMAQIRVLARRARLRARAESAALAAGDVDAGA
jgi:uncharacterized protein (DUF111 family)